MNLRSVCNRLLIFIPFVYVMISERAVSAPSPYGAYRLYAQGSGRVMAMGGVYSALSDNASSVVFNPSGAALEKWTFDIGAESNRVDDSSQPSSSGSAPMFSSTARAYSYQSFSIAARLGRVVVGLGYSTPYEFDFDDTFSQRAKILITSYDALLAYRISNEFSVGVAGHARNLSEEYQNLNSFSTTPSGKVTSTGNSFSAGVSYRTKKSGLGVTYFQPQTFVIDQSLNPVTGSAFFRDVVVPSLTTFGGFYRFNERFMLAADMDQFDVPKDAVDPYSGVSVYSGGDVQLQTGNRQVLRGGFEWTLATDRNMNLIFRGGGYQEPSRFEQGATRFHRTFGLQIRFGPVVLNVSFDQADNFNNTSQGFSLVMGEI